MDSNRQHPSDNWIPSLLYLERSSQMYVKYVYIYYSLILHNCNNLKNFIYIYIYIYINLKILILTKVLAGQGI